MELNFEIGPRTSNFKFKETWTHNHRSYINYNS